MVTRKRVPIKGDAVRSAIGSPIPKKRIDVAGRQICVKNYAFFASFPGRGADASALKQHVIITKEQDGLRFPELPVHFLRLEESHK